VAAAISGGIDNSMQAFAETYADMAIDAALGDSEAAKNLFSKDTFLTALESGLSGGALGGAVGTGLAKLNGGDASLLGQAKYHDRMDRMERAAAQQKEWEARAAEPSQSASPTAPPEGRATGVPGSSQLDAGSAAGREMAGLATEGSGSGPAQQTLGAATREQSAFLKGNSTESMQRAEATAAKSENPAVRQFAEVAASDSLTGKTIGLFTPNAENRGNRAAFEQAYGVTLPDTAGATRRMLREIAAQQKAKSEAVPAVQSAELPSEAASAPQTVQDAPAETADAMPETAAPDNVREATAAVGETDSYENAPLRETLGLRPEAPKTQREAEVQRALEGWRVTDKAAETISKNMPDRVDADRYAAAASPLYRLGRSGAATFAQALELAGSMSGTAEDINYILSTDAGRTALEIAYTQGKGERMLYAEKMTELGGALGSESTSGRGEVYAKDTMRPEGDAADQIIRLNAAATGTDAILYNVLQNDRSIRAYVDTETARIFFGDNAQDIFGTVLHEDYHWYNALDAEGARTLQEHALEYLAKSSGYESLDEMVRAKLEDYSAQSLTYEQAAEELVADAWRGIFDSEESFKRWVTFQRGQAEKNAGKSGAIHKVMEQVRQMLDGLISRAKEVLTINPDNRAALKAKRLAEAEKRTLQDEYFAHAEKAMDNLRTAKENAAALKTESAAEKQGVRFSILKDKTGESYIKIDEDILKDVPQEEWKSTVKQAIKERFPNGFERNGWTILNHKDGRNEFVWSKSTKALQWENAEAYADKMRMAANLDEIIRTADEVYREPANHKNAEAFNRGKIKIQVGQNVYEADVLTAIKTDQREIFYDIVDIKPIKIETSGKAHIESEDSRSSGPEVSVEASGGTHVESEDSRSRLPEASKQSIAQTSDESKRTDEPVKKTVRFQLSESRRNQSELQKESRELERQRRALKEERANWQESNEVRAIEEYQSYLEKRKEFNRRGAELESRIGEVNDKLRQAQAEVENARQAVKQEQQKVYDTKAKAAGGKPEYRRKLAVEQFGTTDRFEQAGYILPDGRMLDFAQNDSTRDTDHREILGVFGPAEVSNGTEALNEFLADGNVRVMAEAPGVDIAAKTPPTEQQLKQIRAMVEQLGSEKRRFTLDISTTDGRVAASKEYSGKVDADKVVREIREYYKTGELPAESELARFRYQRAEQADREAKQNQQRQASRVLAEKAAAFDTLNQFFGLTKNTRLSDAALESLAIRWTKTNGSRADRTKLANETRALVEYLRSEGADMAKAQGLAETLAGEVLDEATYRNTELWNQYPDLHDLTYTVDKNGKAKAELVKRYGSWTEAVAEARRHGVKLRQAEGYRDGNPAEQYEAIVNDTRAVGGVKESAAALFRSAAQEAGVAGAASMKSTEWLDVLMNVHDTIKPKMMSRFADVAEYEDAKVELAGRMIGDIMSHPEMTDAEAVFEGILKHNREVAAMAAGSEERAAEVTKGLKSVQQTQRKAFADRMRENSRSQSAEVKSVSRAERQLNENLETLGAQVSTAAGLDEKMTALREAYEREWKAEKSRMKQARQEMLDEIKLERQQLRSQINDLSRQVAGEQKRADRAEHQLLVQENEIMEWEAENQRKAEAWQEKQAQRNAIAIETARQQRDEDVAVAKALAEKRVQKAREGRKADELKRSIRNNAAQLRQMLLRPKPGKYVQKSLIVQAAEVAKLADMVVLNSNALTKLTALQDSIRRSGEMDVGIHADWENSGVEKLIQTLRDDMNASKQAKLDRLRQQLEEAKALPDGDKAEQLRDRLRQRIRETENRTYLPMTVDQLRMLKAITASTLHIIRTENKTLSLARAEEVDSMAMKAAREVLNSEGNGFGEKFEKAKGAMNRYQLDMLGGTRMFRRLGGYTKNGQMEKLGQMLNDGQRRQTEILVEGESLFANVTGKEHLKEVEAFAGPGAELVDIGLKDSKGNAVPLNHAQLCSLYMLLRNKDSRHHLMTGGLTLPDAAQYAKGNIERAYQRSQTVMLGTLVNADGTPMDDTILQTVQDAMTDYDRNWCKDMEDFFGRYTTNLINETSMKLLGYDRATVKNYYPIAVDRSTLATEIEGVKMDATIEGRGFLKERVKSDKPILLEECQNVVKRSLRDTAAYAGLAAPIRDVQRVLNSTVETAEGIGVLKDKIIGEKWGKETVSYINDLLTDLQTTRRKRSSTMSRALDRMRGNYAGAILTVNPGVAIAQAASLPTAGAVLGADTMAAVLPFVKNFSGKQRAAVEAEIRQHGDALLQYRLRGTKRGEMSSIGAHKNLVAKASEAMPAVTGWITGMDEITVAALWEGSKRYVERHAAEFGEGAAEKGSEAYWEAVNKMYQRVIEETQPNYTTMQRAGIQRSDNEFVKTLTMFTTQRFQNYGILADAVGDYKAQKARYAADQSAENKAEVQRAGQGLRQAAASQVVQTAVFALMKIGADFLLHRWDREQDKNGDVTAKSLGKRFFDLYTESAAGNFLYGSEIYSALTNARDGKDYDVVSATNISAVNDLFAAFTKTVKLLRTDTGEMSEEELTAHHQKLNKAVLKDIQCGLELYGVPAANIRKVMQAFEGYWEDAQAIGRGEGFSFNSAPSSATGQYDRLYNAIQSGDSEEAAAAMKKLEQMNKTDKVDGELARRLKQYDADVLAAAEARNAGKTRAEEKARKAVFEKLREGLDVAPVTDRAKGKADAARRAQLIDLVNKAVDGKADELLAGGKDGSIYDALLDEVKNGRVEDAQEELDRLMTAGKDKGSIKSKITESVKEEYLAGSDRDREKLEKKLLALEDADENPLYEEKNFAQWVSAADKKAEKTKDERNWWEEVK
jgi:tape measure domain-containing protein